MTERELVRSLIEEFAAAAAAMTGSTPQLDVTAAVTTDAWLLRVTASGAITGEVILAVPADDGARLTGLVMGDDAPAPDVVVDCLRELGQQAAGAISANRENGVSLALGADVVQGAAPSDADWTAVDLGALGLRVATKATLAPAKAAPAPAPPQSTPSRPAPPPASQPITAPAGNLDLILDIELPLWVRFGETEMSLQALTRLSPGATVDLERSPEDPVDVMINNVVIARGEVVVVAGNYGVRVTEVVSTTDRIRSMAG